MSFLCYPSTLLVGTFWNSAVYFYSLLHFIFVLRCLTFIGNDLSIGNYVINVMCVCSLFSKCMCINFEESIFAFSIYMNNANSLKRSWVFETVMHCRYCVSSMEGTWRSFYIWKYSKSKLINAQNIYTKKFYSNSNGNPVVLNFYVSY